MRSRPLSKDQAMLATGVLMLLIVSFSALVVLRGHGVGAGPEGFSLGHGETTYNDDDVVFTLGLIAPRRVDADQLFVEIVLLSDGEVVEVVTTNASVDASNEVIPGLRMFENVSVPHHGLDKHSLGLILTLRYRGTVVDQYTYERVPWNG